MTQAATHEATDTPKERGILFSAPMVKAILEGRKTQTRRVVKRQDPLDDFQSLAPLGLKCPYGKRGDLLWVRETWCPWNEMSQSYLIDMNDPHAHDPCIYRQSVGTCDALGAGGSGGKWKPAIHMPRKFSRITLMVEHARVERLQMITTDDIRDEGVEPATLDGWVRLWDAINGKAAPWSSNPWVWRINFKVLVPPQATGTGNEAKEK